MKISFGVFRKGFLCLYVLHFPMWFKLNVRKWDIAEIEYITGF